MTDQAKSERARTERNASAAAFEAPNAAQIEYWNLAGGVTWSLLQEDLDRQIAPLGRIAIEALAPQPGERVLDVGCGCGDTSLQLAERVAPTGHVTGLDISEPMLAVAQRRAAEQGRQDQVNFVLADAQTYEFEPASYDALFSRFGVMFFADPADAFANLRSALKPGGRLAFVCWRPAAENGWMMVPFKAAVGLFPVPPAKTDPLAPGPFAFADAERVRGILSEAGFSDIGIKPHNQSIGGHPLDHAVKLALKVGPLGAMLREQPDTDPAAVAEAVRGALKSFETENGVMLPAAAWIVTARA